MIIEKNGFIHHVFFWLKNPESSDAMHSVSTLIAGLQKLIQSAYHQRFSYRAACKHQPGCGC